ncbi:hypothetical protein [Streptomyces sp. NPDC046860]|uniref:hypothetical protein n=1 Tax=Streptomyces sp. NPDC046860 TaxID=3154495 RepID=UPI0033C5ED5C
MGRVVRRAAVAASVAPLILGVPQAAARGDDPSLTHARVERVGGGTLRPGDTPRVRASFTNSGTRALDRVPVELVITDGLAFAAEYRNCTYGTEARSDAALLTRHRAMCLIDARVGPGESFELAPFGLRVGRYASGEEVAVQEAMTPDRPGEGMRDVHRGRGAELTLTKRNGAPPPADPDDVTPSRGDLSLRVENAWDIEVKGAALSGRQGETVTADLEMLFHGAAVQAQLDAENSIPFTRVAVRFPEGVSVVGVPKLCGRENSHRENRPYLCEYGLYTNGFDLPLLRDGFRVHWPFRLRIDAPGRLTGGEVRVDGPAERLRADADHSNDRAVVGVRAAPRSSVRTTVLRAAGGALVLVLITAGAVAVRRRTAGRSGRGTG